MNFSLFNNAFNTFLVNSVLALEISLWKRTQWITAADWFGPAVCQPDPCTTRLHCALDIGRGGIFI